MSGARVQDDHRHGSGYVGTCIGCGRQYEAHWTPDGWRLVYEQNITEGTKKEVEVFMIGMGSICCVVLKYKPICECA